MKPKQDNERNWSQKILRLTIICLVVVFFQIFLIRSFKEPPLHLNIDSNSLIGKLGRIEDSTYRFSVVADLDKKTLVSGSKKPLWRSYLKKGEIRYDMTTDEYSVAWIEDLELFSKHNEEGRGMELSELVTFNGHLYTMDDRSGIVYEILKEKNMAPRFILTEGNGNTDKGMKIEWSTVKDNQLYLGSFGKEYTDNNNTILHRNNLWIAIIDINGHVTYEPWENNYSALRNATNSQFPGYMIHEAICWSDIHRKWFILPRRVSSESYDEIKDETRGSNILLIASENFDKIDKVIVGQVIPERGFSSCKFMPNSNDNIMIAVKSTEDSASDTTESYITIFTIDGKILLQDTKIPGNKKYEGIEFSFF